MRQIPSLASAPEIVCARREKFDGSGYPRGLKGDSIPLGARIVAVACAVCTFIADRPHDFPRAVNHAGSQISRGSGTAFDPKVVEVLLGLPAEVYAAQGAGTVSAGNCECYEVNRSWRSLATSADRTGKR